MSTSDRAPRADRRRSSPDRDTEGHAGRSAQEESRRDRERDNRPPRKGRNGGPVAPRRGHQRGHATPAAQTSWDPLADWYVGWVGEEGSKHHRLLAIPAVMEALALKPQESVLDIGCGHGVLAGSVLEARGRYTGIDASPRLIEYAQQTQSQSARFIVGDARRLQQRREFRPGGFDAAVFLLSIQDMDELEPVLEGAAWAIRDGGRVVLLITHPCFRIPRQSGWGWDEGRKLRYRRVDRYLTPLPVPLKSFAGGVTRSYHRPLQDYVNGLAAAGLAIDYLREIPTYKTETSGPQAKAINLANREIPLFMAIRARKF